MSVNPSVTDPDSTVNPLALLKAIDAQNLPLFDGSDPQVWFLYFDLFCKKHRICEEDYLEKVQYFLSDLAHERFGGGVKGTLLKLKSIKQAKFQGTDEFIEEISAALNQYQDFVYGSQNTLEGKHARLLFLETQGLDWLCEAFIQEYYQDIETHAPSNVEEAYVLICCLCRFKTHGQLFHSPIAPEPNVKSKPERKTFMPLYHEYHFNTCIENLGIEAWVSEKALC
ncbi:hypothetical protein DSO57_1004889 [Entomophthora muscae]|uniref:Uncharacterized protein n=1 Tax=Entomophthora muscae TaxID=34485 RepID=A0ACC2TV40_9FUNG|nr:hypothetical protein DSO57_1004889 [Entomophthora muscae]